MGNKPIHYFSSCVSREVTATGRSRGREADKGKDIHVSSGSGWTKDLENAFLSVLCHGQSHWQLSCLWGQDADGIIL